MVNNNKRPGSKIKTGARAGGKNPNFPKKDKDILVGMGEGDAQSQNADIVRRIAGAAAGGMAAGALTGSLGNALSSSREEKSLQIEGRNSTKQTPKVYDVTIQNPKSRTGFGGWGGKRTDSIDINLAANFTSLVGYGVPNKDVKPISFTTTADTFLFEDPNREQVAPSTVNSSNYCRTTFKLIDMKAYNVLDTDLTRLLTDMYSAYYQEMLSNTNGGNANTTSNFTLEKFTTYIQDVWMAYAYLQEIVARMAWNSTNPIPNRSLRKLAQWMGNDISLLSARNSLANALAQMVLPSKLLDYGQWLFQIYSCNDHNFSVEQGFMTRPLAEAILIKDFTSYKTEIARVITSITTTNFSSNNSISSLLKAKTTGSWSYIGLRPVNPANSATFDRGFNDLFNNLNIVVPTNDYSKPIYLPSLVGETDLIPACFECGVSEIPKHIVETLASRIAGNYPIFFNNSYTSTATGTGIPTASRGCSQFNLYEDSSSLYGVTGLGVKLPIDQIGNSVIKLFRNSDTTTSTATYSQYQLSPRGDQTFVYDFAANAIGLAQRRFHEYVMN